MKELLKIILLFCFLFLTGSQIAAQANPFADDMLFDVTYGEQSTEGNIFYIKQEEGLIYFGISDETGFPLYSKRFSDEDFHFQPHQSGELSYYNKDIHSFILLNKQLEVVDTVSMTDGYMANYHEFYIDDDGNRWMMAYDSRSVDMSLLCEEGSSDATVTGIVIQCVDDKGNLVFEWNGWEHFSILDTYVDTSSMSIDYVHANSIQRDSDTTFILSSRNLSEVSKINMRTGDFVWRLGGKNNQFAFFDDPKNGFSAQHTANLQANGMLTVFDNGVFDNSAESRGVMYQLNEQEKTATLLAEFKHNPSLIAFSKGNFSVLPNANSWIFWGLLRGATPSAISEYDQDHSLIYDAWLKPLIWSYRIYKDDWQPEVLQVSNKELSFTQIDANAAPTRELTVFNESSIELVLNVAYSPSSVFVLEDDLPITIPAKGSHVIHLSFKPKSSGEYAADMFLAHQSDSLLHSVKLSLSGTADFVSIEPNGFKNELLVYPNPFNEHFSISGLLESEAYHYRVIDESGRTVKAGLLEGSVLFLADLSAGMYFLELSWGDGTAIKRIQKVCR